MKVMTRNEWIWIFHENNGIVVADDDDDDKVDNTNGSIANTKQRESKYQVLIVLKLN